MEVRFGVAGNPPNFWGSSFKKERANSPFWLKGIGLDALEIQCTYGVKMPEERIDMFKRNSEETSIELSIHAPYYISFGSSERRKIDNSINELKKAVILAKKIGSKKVIFHVGGAFNEREKALKRAIFALKCFEKENNVGAVKIYPEIAGKIGQIGSLEDILEICSEIDCALPCLDFAHLHARTKGSLVNEKAFREVFDQVEKRLGKRVLKDLHIHMYPIAWSVGGETSHKAFSDLDESVIQGTIFDKKKPNQFFQPRYEPLIDLIVDKKIYPTIICEAKNSQDVGALEMKRYYLKRKE